MSHLWNTLIIVLVYLVYLKMLNNCVGPFGIFLWSTHGHPRLFVHNKNRLVFRWKR